MAEATEPTVASTPEQASAAAAPAAQPPEPQKGRAILESAKAELKTIRDQKPPSGDESAQEPAAAPPSETPSPEQEGPRPKEENRRLREQIRKEVQREFEAEQQAMRTRQQTEAQQREFDELLARADGGDWEAKDRVMTILKGNRGMQAAIMQGRTAVLQELGQELTSAIYNLDGIDDDGQTALMKAPSVTEFGKQAFEHGRRIERSIHEGTIATLKAENESLKGRLAGNGPSPTPTNGSVSNPRTPNGRFQSMHDAFAASAAELGYRART